MFRPVWPNSQPYPPLRDSALNWAATQGTQVLPYKFQETSFRGILLCDRPAFEETGYYSVIIMLNEHNLTYSQYSALLSLSL